MTFLLFYITSFASTYITQYKEPLYIVGDYLDINTQNIDIVLDNINKGIKYTGLDTLPVYMSVGAIVRCQHHIGGCVGYQFNISKEDGIWYITKYRLLAAFIGIAEIAKIELYLAACFGNCMESYDKGWYLTGDAMTTIPTTGLANLGLFFELGLDVTESFNILTQLLYPKENMTVYLGGGLDIGAGYGVSLGLYRYKKLFKKEINDIDITDMLML